MREKPGRMMSKNVLLGHKRGQLMLIGAETEEDEEQEESIGFLASCLYCSLWQHLHTCLAMENGNSIIPPTDVTGYIQAQRLP